MRNARGISRILGVGAILFAIFSGRAAKATEPRQRSFVLDYRVKIGRLPVGARRVRFWVPLAESDRHQEVLWEVRADFPTSIEREPTHGNKLLYAEIRNLRGPLVELNLEFTVHRKENVRFSLGTFFPLSVKDPASEGVNSKWLTANRLVPIDGRIYTLSEEICRGLRTPLEKAQAIYSYVFQNMAYDKSGDGWGRGDAIYACDVRRGNCTDFHALFIGLMRAQGIPTKFEIGFQIPEERGWGKVSGYHCWAEFYLEGRGWTPVDISEAWKHQERKSYYFGAHDENRVLFTTGRDLRLSPDQTGVDLNYFIYPYVEVDGVEFTQVTIEFFYKDLPG